MTGSQTRQTPSRFVLRKSVISAVARSSLGRHAQVVVHPDMSITDEGFESIKWGIDSSTETTKCTRSA